MKSNFFSGKNLKFKDIFQKFYPLSKGVTLTEVMIAAMISGFVITAAGSALRTMMESNARHEEASQRSLELSRALAYISEDIRMANNIQALVGPTGSPLLDGDPNKVGVFMLTIPDDPNSDDPDFNDPAFPADGDGDGIPDGDPPEHNIVYFISPSTPTWLPPNTIYRAKNDYSGGLASLNALNATGVNELIDSIEAPNTPPTCNGGILEGDAGFYACLIDDDGDTNPDGNAELYLYGRLNNDPTADTYRVDTKAFTRSKP